MERSAELNETMKLLEMQEQIDQIAVSDTWYQQCLGAVREREPAFLALRATLSETQQEQLDSYIAACEELEYSRVYIAYEFGKVQGDDA